MDKMDKKWLTETASELSNIMLKSGILEKYAKITKKYFEELRKQGFSYEDSLKIVANFNVTGGNR